MDPRPVLFAALTGAVLTGGVQAAVAAMPAAPVVQGVGDGAVTTSDVLDRVHVTAADPRSVRLVLDGTPLPVRYDGQRIVPPRLRLPEGTHTLTAQLGVLADFPRAEVSRTFTVDDTPPRISLEPVEAGDLRVPVTVRGVASGAERVMLNGEPVDVGSDGSFSATLPTPPGSVDLTAQDRAGNVTRTEQPVHAKHPGMRGVHMTALAWAFPALREPVLQMARDGLIDTVQLDIKDEDGEIGYDSQVPLAREIGAAKGYYDARAVLDQLHAMKIRVVGRLVAFRDPLLARASWDAGHRERLVQTSDGEAWASGYGDYTFTNFANPEVRDYNIRLAAEAAELGFDDILYDYIRRPEGSLDRMRLPGLTGTPEQAIADFLEQSRDAVHGHGAFLGASVFGIAITRPTQIAQDIPAMSREVDYIAPMVYPSHWGRGEYGIDDPEDAPHDITARSLADFAKQARQGGAITIPWLQAFSMHRTYGPAEVQAQIAAAKENGMDSFLLWNAACRYDPAALGG
ncbi:putative glycoside hydrolase [Amycolatopsis dongchuanensis]|uniref:putative glycoside hydrolase n=1 Tax=Amycolatopsis dongchuanensis TaxID=1070866 RepID=UPI0031F9BA02